MSATDHLLHDDDSTRRYSAALLHASGRVPDEQIDWDAFHARLSDRAQLSLARLRHPQAAWRTLPLRRRTSQSIGTIAWWEHAARWSRLIVTASVAAGIALIMVVRASPKEMGDTIVATAVARVDQFDRTRAAFDSAAIGHSAAWTIDSALLPSATDLLIPLGRGARTP